MIDGEPGQAAEERFRRFLKIFEDLAKSSKNQAQVSAAMIEVANRMIQATSAVVEVIGHEKEGAISAIDDLIVEIQGLRKDLQDFLKGIRVLMGQAARFRG